MTKRYNSMSIDKVDGRTYWHKSFNTIEEVKAHCNRYVSKPCDIIVYDISKDLGAIKDAKIRFNYLIEKYPDTEYALDANFKLDLINEYLASKEMYIGRYYFQKKKMDFSYKQI